MRFFYELGVRNALEIYRGQLGIEIASARMSMKHVIFIACLIAVIHLTIATLFAQEQNLIQAARREGRVVWYTVAGESLQIAQEFEKKYPFVKVEVVRSTVYPLLNRIFNETRAGSYLFDVASVDVYFRAVDPKRIGAAL